MSYLRLPLLFAFLFATALSAFGANLSQVKAAMKERQPEIESLWADGKIGENNQGYVKARTELPEAQQALVEAENADRKTVYKAIASATQSTPKQVGIQRAAQISKRAAKGLWLQDADGKWYRK